MPYKDLREFLSKLRDIGELTEVSHQIDPNYEIGAICRKVLDARGPALIFNNIRNTVIPLAVNFLATRERYTLALETNLHDLHKEWIRRTSNPIEPVLVEDGPCNQNIITGSDIDLLKLPAPVWNELDGGPFITFPCNISKDPVTGTRNVGMYRAQILGPNKLGILAIPARHLAMHRAKAKGQPFPVAIAIGVSPVVSIATVASFPSNVDELAMAGALQGQPVKLVNCATIPLEAPASAEVIIEGLIYPDEYMEEGPFGEFTGYYGVKNRRPVITVTAITCRDNPIFTGSYAGRPPGGSAPMTVVPVEAEIMRLVSVPGIIKVHSIDGGIGFNVVVSIDKTFQGQGKVIAMAVLGTWGARLIKTLIIVDKDIDPEDQRQVEWALATRVQPHRDIEIIHDLPGVSLDPSMSEIERVTGRSWTSKVIIDTTKYDVNEHAIPCCPKPDVMAYVEANWEQYGIKLG